MDLPSYRLLGRASPFAYLPLLVLLLGGCDEPRRSNPVPAPVTFHRDIAPILARQCITCHHPAGSAPFSLLTYDDAKKHAADIAKVTQVRFMPPWLPEKDFGHFADERRLTDTEIDTISRWVNAGAPAGSSANVAIPTTNPSWQLGPPDLIVQMPQSYALAPSGKDVYRNFVVPLDLSAPHWVRAVEFHPGNTRVVHHAFVLFDTSGSARRMDARDEELGYGGMDTGEDVSMPPGQLLSWQPGKVPSLDDQSRSWRLAKGTDMVLQVHMRPDGKPESVQPSVGFYFTDTKPTQFPFVLLLKSTSIDIPAGEKNYLVESSYTLPVDVDLLRILPHAHYLGHELAGNATLPDGTVQPLILIKNWDFSWQGDYRYAAPVSLPKGTRLSMRFTYDNSESNIRNPNHPPQRVRYGPQSSDEMAELWLQLIPKNPQDFQALLMDYRLKYNIPDLITHYRDVLKEDSTDATTRAKLGGALVTLGQTDDGIAELRRAIETDSANVTAHFNLATTLARQNNLAEAMSEFEATLRADPDHYRAHNNLGMIYLKQGNLDLAARHLYNALRLNPNDILANSNLANVFLAQRNWGQARLQLQTLLSLDPDNQPAQELLRQLQTEIDKTR